MTACENKPFHDKNREKISAEIGKGHQCVLNRLNNTLISQGKHCPSAPLSLSAIVIVLVWMCPPSYQSGTDQYRTMTVGLRREAVFLNVYLSLHTQFCWQACYFPDSGLWTPQHKKNPWSPEAGCIFWLAQWSYCILSDNASADKRLLKAFTEAERLRNNNKEKKENTHICPFPFSPL